MDNFTPDCTNNTLHRLSDISRLFCGEYAPISLDWVSDLNWQGMEGMNQEPDWEGMTVKLQHIFMCQINFHSMRTGSFESLFQSVNELILEWQLLIISDLNGLYNAAEIYQFEINNLPRVWTPPPPPDPSPSSQTSAPPPTDQPSPVQQRRRNKTRIGGRGQYQTNVSMSVLHPPRPPPPPPCAPPPCPPSWVPSAVSHTV
jgi:hypothetical protein